MKRIIRFFKDIFSDDVGKKHPKPKIRIKWVIYWVVGLLLALIIPTCLVYLEAWVFSWNIVSIIWPKGENYLYRGGHFLAGVGTIFIFVLLGYMNPENLNGDERSLGLKKPGRFLLGICGPMWITCFILANIFY